MDMSDRYRLRDEKVLLWKKSCIDLFIERLDIVSSDISPDICPWVDIAMALPVFTYKQIDVIIYKYVISNNKQQSEMLEGTK